MDKGHYILIAISILFIILFGISKSGNMDYINEVQKLENDIKIQDKKIKIKDGLIKELRETTSQRDTIINVIIKKRNENNYSDSIRFIRNADDSIIWNFLTTRYLKDSSKGLRY